LVITGELNAYESAYDGNSFNGNAFVDFIVCEDKTLLFKEGLYHLMKMM
jgi:hypothetical protein